MISNSGWLEPDSVLYFLRATTKKFAHSFIEKGTIKFNTPESWAKLAIKDGEGRGDILEGTIATYNINLPDVMKKITEKYESRELLRIQQKKRVLLKDKTSMELPCYCMFAINTSAFNCPNKVGKATLTNEIAASYFKDFMNNMTVGKVEKLEENDKPAVLFIENAKEFYERLFKKITEIGVQKKEIIFLPITYFDFDKYAQTGWVDTDTIHPMELLVKNKKFENQREVRIIINTENKELKKYLLENVIKSERRMILHK